MWTALVTWVSGEDRDNLQDLVQRQKRSRAAARKFVKKSDIERNLRIAENLSATAAAAKLAAERSLHLNRSTAPAALDLKDTHNSSTGNGAVIEDDEIPPECVYLASQLLAEVDDVFKKPRCSTTHTVLSARQFSRKAGSSRNGIISDSTTQHKNLQLKHMYKSFPGSYNAELSNSKFAYGRPEATLISTSLPSKNRTIKPPSSDTSKTNGFGVQANSQTASFSQGPNNRITSWKDAETEQARLQARLCASRARRFVHLDADGDDIISNVSGASKALTSSSSSDSSKDSSLSEATHAENLLEHSKNADCPLVEVDKPPDWKFLTGRPEIESRASQRSLFDNHLKYLQEQSEREFDPLRFIEVYKQKHQQLTIHSRGDSFTGASRINNHAQIHEKYINNDDCASVSEIDKTSEAASSIPSLVEESSKSESRVISHQQTGVQQRLAPATLGLSLTTELHQYETVSASQQHITGLEMTRRVSRAQTGSLSIYQVGKAGILYDPQGNSSSHMTHVKKELKNTAVSPIVLPRLRVPVTFAQTITQRNFSTTTAATATRLHDSSQVVPLGSPSGTSSYYIHPRAHAGTLNLNVYDANVTPSNLETSTALNDPIDLKSEQVKGMLQERASELHARRHEAELLLEHIAKLDREERKVVALELRAVKALTKSKIRHLALQAPVSAPLSTHSASIPGQTVKAIGERQLSPILAPLPTASSSPPPPSPSTSQLSSSSTASLSIDAAAAEVVEKAPSVKTHGSLSSVPNLSASKSIVEKISPRFKNSSSLELLRTIDIHDNVGEFGNADSSRQPIPQCQPECHNQPPRIISQDSTNSSSPSPSGLSSSQFVFHLEARLSSLQKELRRNEKLLGLIDVQKKVANKDRLLRLETTLENHRKFCLEVIDNIKFEINSCHQSLCEAVSSVGLTPIVASRITPSLELSSLDKSACVSFHEPRQTREYLTTPSSLTSFNTEEAVGHSSSVPVPVKVASSLAVTDLSNSPITTKAYGSSGSNVGKKKTANDIIFADSEESKVLKTSRVSKSDDSIVSEISSTQRSIFPNKVDTVSTPPPTGCKDTVSDRSHSLVRVIDNGSISPIETAFSEMSNKASTSTKSIPFLVDSRNASLKADSCVKTVVSEITSEKSIFIGFTPSLMETHLQDFAQEKGENALSDSIKRGTSAESLPVGQESEDYPSETAIPDFSLDAQCNSGVRSVEVQSSISAKALTNKVSIGLKSESTSCTGDVYTEDFEDEDFTDQKEEWRNGLMDDGDAIADKLIAPFSNRVEASANLLLDQFTDQWLEDFIDEVIYGAAEAEECSKSADYEVVIVDTTGMVANAPSRTVPLFKEAITFFYQLRASSKPGTFEEALNSATYPPHFTATYVDDEDVKICDRVAESRLIDRMLFFDLVRTGMLEIFAGEDKDIQNNREPQLSSSRLRMWRGARRPESQSRWEAILAPQLEAILGMSLDPTACSNPLPIILPEPQVFDPSVQRSSLVKWTLNSKTCWIEQLLEVEMRGEDPSWLDFEPFVQPVVESAVAGIVEELAHDAIIDALKKLRCGDEWKERKKTGKYVLLI